MWVVSVKAIYANVDDKPYFFVCVDSEDCQGRVRFVWPALISPDLTGFKLCVVDVLFENWARTNL
jgi:hypothetical protein